MRRALLLAGWLALVPMGGFALLRLAGVERGSALFTGLLTLTVVLLAPAWAVLGVAVAARDLRLAGAAGALAALHLAWSGPELRWWGAAQPDATGPHLRVVAANVLHANPTPHEAAATIAAHRPDVVVASELTPPAAAALDRLGLPHRLVEPHPSPDAYGIGIYSRHPVVERERRLLAGAPALRVVLDVDGRRVTVVGVHTTQPLGGTVPLRAQLADLRRLAERTDGPLVLAGDFNATAQHAPFRALLETRVRDAHLDRGRGLARTWPMDRPGPPVALLDHVLVSDEVAVLEVAEATIPGSDHRAVVADLALARSGR